MCMCVRERECDVCVCARERESVRVASLLTRNQRGDE